MLVTHPPQCVQNVCCCRWGMGTAYLCRTCDTVWPHRQAIVPVRKLDSLSETRDLCCSSVRLLIPSLAATLAYSVATCFDGHWEYEEGVACRVHMTAVCHPRRWFAICNTRTAGGLPKLLGCPGGRKRQREREREGWTISHSAKVSTLSHWVFSRDRPLWYGGQYRLWVIVN